MRWIEVDVHTVTDPKIDRLLRKFGNQGLGVLLRTWLLVAAKGARPGQAIDSNGEPFEVDYMANQVHTSPTYLRRLLDAAAVVGHIDRELWRRDRLAVFPALAKRAAKFHQAKTGAERVKDFRAKRFDRIAERDGRFCCRCRATQGLELERRRPKEEGGGDDDPNLAIVCLPCGRRRRAERQGKADRGAAGPAQPAPEGSQPGLPSGPGGTPPLGHQYAKDDLDFSSVNPAERNRTLTQRVTESDVLYCTDDVRTSLVRTHTGNLALTRENSPPAPQPLPLIGEVPAGPRDHVGHVWCVRKCVPGFLHNEFLASLGGDRLQAPDARAREFYRLTIERYAGRDIPDPPLKFWRREFAAHFTKAAELLGEATERVTGARAQDMHKRSTACTASTAVDGQVAKVRASIARLRAGGRHG